MTTRRMTPHFSLTGIKPAVDSVEKVLAKVTEAHPELIEQLSTEGMICVRHRNPAHGPPSSVASNHSWGTAVDFKLRGGQAPKATGEVVPRFVAMLVPFFNEAGWFSGIGFDDAMHFEVADETIRKWARDGLLGPAPPPEETVVAGGENASGSSSGSSGGGIGGFFSRLFGSG